MSSGLVSSRLMPRTSLKTVPENRVYVSPERSAQFVKSFLDFSHGQVVSDVDTAPGIEIGRNSETFCRIRSAVWRRRVCCRPRLREQLHSGRKTKRGSRPGSHQSLPDRVDFGDVSAGKLHQSFAPPI